LQGERKEKKGRQGLPESVEKREKKETSSGGVDGGQSHRIPASDLWIKEREGKRGDSC